MAYSPSDLHHASRENSHNASSNVLRVSIVNGLSVTVPVRTLITTGTAERLQFIFLSQSRSSWWIVGDNYVDDIIVCIWVDVGAQKIHVSFIAFQLQEMICWYGKRIRKRKRDKPQIANRLLFRESFVKLIPSLALTHACDQQSCFPAWPPVLRATRVDRAVKINFKKYWIMRIWDLHSQA